MQAGSDGGLIGAASSLSSLSSPHMRGAIPQVHSTLSASVTQGSRFFPLSVTKEKGIKQPHHDIIINRRCRPGGGLLVGDRLLTEQRLLTAAGLPNQRLITYAMSKALGNQLAYIHWSLE